jgi:hypothetical protein
VDVTIQDWAEAIALRISDEWSGRHDCPEDAELLEEVLTKILVAVPKECMRLVGTGIIECSYFEPLD